MDKPKNNQETQTQGSQEKKEPQLRSVEEYQKYWDQLLQNTADQIQKIRGECTSDICRVPLTTIDKEQAAERSNRDSPQ